MKKHLSTPFVICVCAPRPSLCLVVHHVWDSSFILGIKLTWLKMRIFSSAFYCTFDLLVVSVGGSRGCRRTVDRCVACVSAFQRIQPR
jgi:hypothetical protein